MLLSELDANIQQKLKVERTELHSKWKVNTPYQICFTNAEGTRYFSAVRKQSPWNDDKGHYMNFGGGSCWHITYGKILWSTTKNPVGETEYVWVKSSKIFGKSLNGTIIPSTLPTKAEVLKLAECIGGLVL